MKEFSRDLPKELLKRIVMVAELNPDQNVESLTLPLLKKTVGQEEVKFALKCANRYFSSCCKKFPFDAALIEKELDLQQIAEIIVEMAILCLCGNMPVQDRIRKHQMEHSMDFINTLYAILLAVCESMNGGDFGLCFNVRENRQNTILALIDAICKLDSPHIAVHSQYQHDFVIKMMNDLRPSEKSLLLLSKAIDKEREVMRSISDERFDEIVREWQRCNYAKAATSANQTTASSKETYH